MTTLGWLSEVQWGDVGTWAASIFTGGALIAALVQISRERSARQVDKADAVAERQQQQAARVSIWWGGHQPGETNDWLIMMNRSDAPVYQVIAFLVLVQGSGPTSGEELVASGPTEWIATMTNLPPGRWRVAVPGGWGGMSRRPGAEIAFLDAAGESWVRRANGQLERLPSEPPEHYGLSRPLWNVRPEPDPPSVPGVDSES